MSLDKKVYDILKWIAMYPLPALGTLYFALASIWGFPYGEEVVGTITALDTFLGVILGISKSGYQGDGEILVNTDNPEKDVYTLAFNDDNFDEMIRASKYITLKVQYNPDLNDG